MHCPLCMIIEYKTENDKNRLLQDTINAICNNLQVKLSMGSDFFKNKFFSSPKFVLFKTTIEDAKNGTNIDDQRTKAREAIDIWDFQVKFHPLSDYVKLLQQILDLFKDNSKRYHVWIKESRGCMLQTIEESQLLRQEHIARRQQKPDDVKSTEPVSSAPEERNTVEVKPVELAPRDITSLLRELQELIHKYIPVPPTSHAAD